MTKMVLRKHPKKPKIQRIERNVGLPVFRVSFMLNFLMERAFLKPFYAFITLIKIRVHVFRIITVRFSILTKGSFFETFFLPVLNPWFRPFAGLPKRAYFR